ncbi:hypothetical protein BS47DRAFT_1403376 [Hydnum rufescens UP504]|uniref:Uncharacterized protein n=1 Tax=Hydnum rufescens UP504 TaxID=1448309 RepID=A0A9P6DKR6_9AGAM|nr:hypothetical protein BS47DRAFT_1403376 [Hydnum rufescens UP504]
MTGASTPNVSTRAYPNLPNTKGVSPKMAAGKIELVIEKVLHSPALKARGDSQDQASECCKCAGCRVERGRAFGGRTGFVLEASPSAGGDDATSSSSPRPPLGDSSPEIEYNNNPSDTCKLASTRSTLLLSTRACPASNDRVGSTATLTSSPIVGLHLVQ